MRMGLLSLFSLGLGYVLTVALTTAGDMDPKRAYGIAIVICSVFNFYGCRHFVFPGAKASVWVEAVRFFPSVLAFRGFELLLFSGLMALHANYHVAYFVTAAISMAGKVLVSRVFIFKRPTG